MGAIQKGDDRRSVAAGGEADDACAEPEVRASAQLASAALDEALRCGDSRPRLLCRPDPLCRGKGARRTPDVSRRRVLPVGVAHPTIRETQRLPMRASYSDGWVGLFESYTAGVSFRLEKGKSGTLSLLSDSLCPFNRTTGRCALVEETRLRVA